jgi:D-glycero-D-manno-heptose 1,7-bisphosphate phosphatase
MLIRAVILDRDGTLIKHVHYLRDAEKVQLLEGVKEGINNLMESEIKLFLHTNQSGVGRGYFPIEDVHLCNNRMMTLLGCDRGFEGICIATESPEGESVYRKPSPMFAQEIMRNNNFTSMEICYVGDRVSDLLTAKASNCWAVGVNTGLINLEEETREYGINGDYPIASNFLEVVEIIKCIQMKIN